MLDKVKIEKMLFDGMNVSEIGEELQIPYHNLYYFIRKQGIRYKGRENNGKSTKARAARNNTKKITDIDLLRKLYEEGGLSINAVSTQLKTTAATVFATLKEHGIKTRLKNGEYQHKTPQHSKTTLVGLYVDKGLSMQEIADLLGYKNHGLVQRDLLYYGIPSRTYKEAGTLLYEKHPEKCELHRQQFYDGITGPKQNKPTWIELAFEQWAANNNLLITQQYQLRTAWHRYDFHINDTNILVEMDGVFWHSLPEHKERDKQFDETASKHGFKVIRITDNELKLYGSEIFDIIIKPLLEENEQ